MTPIFFLTTSHIVCTAFSQWQFTYEPQLYHCARDFSRKKRNTLTMRPQKSTLSVHILCSAYGCTLWMTISILTIHPTPPKCTEGTLASISIKLPLSEIRRQVFLSFVTSQFCWSQLSPLLWIKQSKCRGHMSSSVISTVGINDAHDKELTDPTKFRQILLQHTRQGGNFFISVPKPCRRNMLHTQRHKLVKPGTGI